MPSPNLSTSIPCEDEECDFGTPEVVSHRATCVGVYHNLLVFSTRPHGSAYAFMSLEQTVLAEVDEVNLQIFIGCQEDPDDDFIGGKRLGICVLLTDGRFQTLLADEIALTMTQDCGLDEWVRLLHDSCFEDRSLRL